MNTKTIKDNLKTIYGDYCKEYQRGADASYKRRLSELKAGDVAPASRGFFYADDRDRFAERASDYREKARAVVDDAMQEVRVRKTDSPTTEAVNYINLLRNKHNVTEEEISNAVERYGDNYSCYHALRDIAEDNHVLTLDVHPLDKITEGLENTLSSINQMGVINAERGRCTDGASSVFGMSIDINIPDYSD